MHESPYGEMREAGKLAGEREAAPEWADRASVGRVLDMLDAEADSQAGDTAALWRRLAANIRRELASG